MDKFEKRRIKKEKIVKNSCFDWLIIFQLLKKIAGKFKDRILSLYNPNHGDMAEKEMHLFFLSDISIYLS